jgi:hypothetical protein
MMIAPIRKAMAIPRTALRSLLENVTLIFAGKMIIRKPGKGFYGLVGPSSQTAGDGQSNGGKNV